MNFEGPKNIQSTATIIMEKINKLYYVKLRTSIPQNTPLNEKKQVTKLGEKMT